MPIQLRVNTELGLIVCIFEGAVTTEEFNEQLFPAMELPQYTLMPLTLLDMTRALSVEPPSEIIRRFAQRAASNVDNEIEGEAKMAMVATSSESFGLGRMYEMLRGGSPVEFTVVESLEEAEQWLGLPHGYEDQLEDVL